MADARWRQIGRDWLLGVVVALAVASLGAMEPAVAAPRVRQITFGPQHHFFGYIGQSRTTPWNASGRCLLALQTTVQDRLPDGGDAADVCVLDAADNYRVRVVDRTRGWNPQQGTMFYWNPEHPETQFFFNDRDPRTGKVFTVLFDLTLGARGARVREYRFEDTPVANGGVAQNGGYFLAINYARLARLRPVTGYKGARDWTDGVAAPDNDGLFRVDVATGAKRLIVSFAALKAKMQGVVSRLDERHLFINHTLNNRNNDLVYFYCRANYDGKASEKINVPFTVRPDGSELTRHEVFIGGHPEWEWGSRVIGAIGDRQVIYDAGTGKVVGGIGNPGQFRKPGGDIALSADGRWFVNGAREGERNHYVFFDRRSGQTVEAPPVFIGGWHSDDLRVDPAPCWNRTGDAVAVSGIAGDGTRQMFLIEVGDLTRE
jgi:hypothetical protein